MARKAAKATKIASDRPARRLKIPLSLKFVTAIVVLAALLTAGASALGLWSSYSGTERTALAVQQEQAEALAGRIDALMSGIETQLAWTAQRDWKEAGVEQQRADFQRLLRQFPAITELFYIDAKGLQQLKVSRLAPDSVASLTNHANEPRFTETVNAGTWVGPIYVRNGIDLAGTLGMAHADGGVTIAELNLAFLDAPVKAASSDDVKAFVVDAAGRLIAHPDTDPVSGESDLSGLPQVAAALAAGGAGTSADAVQAGDAAPAFAAWTQLPRLGWTVIVQTSKADAFAPFEELLWQTALLLGGGLLAATIVGLSLARRVAAPIKKLQASVERIGEGDLAQRVDVRRRDEIGGLADRFNAMASRLQQSRMGLEAKIDDSAVGFDVALQEQSLTAEMLRTISRTDYDLERVLDQLIGSAVRLSEANVGAVWLREGDAFRLAAQLGHTSDWVEAARKTPFTRDTDIYAVAAAAAFSGQLVNVDDTARDLRFMGDYGERPANSDERSALAVPLKHEGRVEAVFSLSRADPIPFSERQVAVAQDFADQALIAIRIVRLNETVETRDRDLAQSLEEHTAGADMLRAIAEPPGDPRPVLDRIAKNAARLSKARYCHLALLDGSLLHLKAHHGLPSEAVDPKSGYFPTEPAAGSAAEQAIAKRKPVLLADLQAGPEATIDPLSRQLDIRSLAVIPLVEDGAAIGVLTIADPVANAFSERRLALLSAFADQAVIALTGSRLADELRARTSERDASLGREAATDGLLQAIGRSDYELDAVLARLADRAARECGADEVRFFRPDGTPLLPRSAGGAAAESHAGLAGRAIAGGSAITLPDNHESAANDTATRPMLGLPLLAKGEIFGAMTLSRGDAAPFGAAQAGLAATLADQAALAVAGKWLPEQLAVRTAERDEARQLHVEDVEAAERKHAAEMEETRRSHAAELYENRRQHTSEIDQAFRRHEAELGAAREAHAEELSQTIENYTAEVSEARRLHVEDVEQTRERYEAELAETRRLHGEQLNETISTHANELDATIKAHADELSQTINAYTAELADARELHATEVAEARRLYAHERDAAHLQRIATAEALRRIATPSDGIDAALAAVVGAAARACGADAAILLRWTDDHIEADAMSGLSEEAREATLALVRDTFADETVFNGTSVEIADISGSSAGEAPFRAALGVPVVEDGAVLGALVLLRGEPGSFGEAATTLAGSFADQAAVAIETDRLSRLAAERAMLLDEALRFRMASANLLGLVGSLGTDPQPALDAVVATAAELCKAGAAELHVAEVGATRLLAARGPVGDGAVAEQAILEASAVHRTAKAEGDGPSLLSVPFMLDGRAAGALTLTRAAAAAFDEREIELASVLAAMAAITIAKARLASALEERSLGLARALREREATAGMLAAVGRSRFDLGSVLDRLAGSAAELCDAGMAAICIDDGSGLQSTAAVGFPEAWFADARYADIAGLAQRAAREATPLTSSIDLEAGYALAVPLRSNDGASGALVIVRPAAFGNDDVAVAETLADQAAIAFTNSKLIATLEARTNELAESLRQQAATADMMRSVNDAAFELTDLLSAVASHAARFGNAAAARIYLRDGDGLAFADGVGLAAEQRAYEEAYPLRIGPDSWLGRAAIGKAVVHVPDLTANLDGIAPDAARFGDAAAMLCVPILRDGAAIGVLALTRRESGQFGERQIELAQTFCDQVAVAIETVRLLAEAKARTADFREVLRQQSAISDVLATISRSTFDPDAVLATLTAQAASLCHAAGAAIFMLKDGTYPVAAATGAMPEQLVDTHPSGADSWVGRVALYGQAIHVPDIGNDVEHPEIARIGGLAAILCVPLLRDRNVIGVLALTRSEPEPFTERQIELVNAFATQAVIATANMRMLDEARARAQEIEALLKDLHAAQTRLGEVERLATLGRYSAGLGHEIEERLVAVNVLSAKADALVDDIRMVLEGAVIDGGTRGEVEELGDTLKEQLDEVVWQGKRAEGVVRNTLLQSLEGHGDRRMVDINAVVDESLGLAYHGARTERHDFRVTLEKALDPKAGAVDAYPQEITRVLLNLISNGLDATARRDATTYGGYEPVLAASTRNLGDAVEIRIRDNGTGIPSDVRDRLFDPFFTTKPAGQGTGLGLSQSRDIIVKQHGGTIEVESEPGSFTEFRIVLPRGGASLAGRDPEPEASQPG